MVLNILAELFLYLHFSLIFSVTFLGTVLFYRTRDKYIRRFLEVLYPLVLYLSLLFLVNYLTGMKDLIPVPTESTMVLSLLMSFGAASFITLIIRGSYVYTFSLIPFKPSVQYRLNAITNISCIFLFIGWCFSIFYVSRGNWLITVVPTLNLWYLIASGFVFLQSVLAFVFLRWRKEERAQELYYRIIYSYLPLAIFIPLDIIFFRDSAFKLTYISYTIFIITSYLYMSRYYVLNYEPEQTSLEQSKEGFYRKFNISDREKEIIELLIEGMPNIEIAEKLCISINTVKTHVQNIYQKTNVSNRVQLLHRIKIWNQNNRPIRQPL
ncbi:MAG: helix-turn-helix transcriptional regulator [Spirochaetales bacterium]|nr:helix-turn-helix transcriptional regulator [Spirochaetales bacterium]